jgi:penicillin-binding protein 1A
VSDSSKPEIAREAGTKTARSPTPPESLEGVPVTVLLCLLVSRAYRALATGCAAVRQGFGTATAKLRVSRPNWRMPAFPWRPGVRYPRLFLLALIAALPAAYLLYCLATLPLAAGPADRPTTGAFIVQTADGKTLATRGVYKGEEITPDRIPQTLANAVIAIEDRRFYEHGGIDPRGIARALWNDLTGGDLQGASTITQQLARLRYLSQERSLRRKVHEAMLALWLEWKLSKNEILAQYLNAAYFGYGAYGADAAAQRYFSKHAGDLSLTEAAMLAGLVRAPSALAPDKNLEGARQRASVVLDAMVSAGTITPEQANAAREHPAQLRVAADAPAGSNYFIDTAVREAHALAPNAGSDVILRTTIDPGLQRLAENVVAKDLAPAERAKNVHQAALVAMTRGGAILAMVGGRDYKASQFNRVTQAKRQPGSLFKLFVYLAALRKGFTPDDTIVDKPISIGNWEPENYADRYYGPVSLRLAFAHSLNSVAVQLSEQVGIDQVIETAKRAGIRSDLPNAPSIALGTGNVTLLEMTSAFAAVASNVSKIEPFTVREIRRTDQKLYNRETPRLAQADDGRVHAEMLDLLEAPVREGTATAARIGIPVGGKTGTSQDYRNAWFVGFTPDLVVGVWVGNDDNAPMNSVTGGSIPAAIWRDFVSGAKRFPARPAETVSLAPSREPEFVSRPPAPASNTAQAAPVLSGKLKMQRDGSLEIDGQTIHLAGVENLDRHLPRHIRRLLRRMEVQCVPAGQPQAYNCTAGDLDLNALILLSRGESPETADALDARAADDDFPPPPPRHRRSHHRLWFFHW